MSSDDSLIGRKLGDYEIRELLGRGGMARVYRGYDANLERYAAVKVFDAQGFNEDELEEYRARFQREARAIARLRHPSIVNVYQTGQEGHYNYMAMMFIEGRDLRQILKDHVTLGTRMSQIEILRIITDIAEALDYAHAEGVIHRDVKPSNIMVTAEGRAILTDFGLALNVPDGTIGTTFGTVHYIAPEQAISSAQAVPQSDLYSLGVVLYEMLVGKVPFDDQSAMSVALRHISDPPPPPSMFNPEIKPAVEKLVLKMLEKDPADRYQSGKALVTALESAFQMVDEDDDTRRMPLPPAVVQAAVTGRAASTGETPASDDADDLLPSVVTSDSDNDPTLVDWSQPKPAENRRSRTGVYVIGVVALLLLAAVALVLAGGLGGGEDDVTATVSPSRTAVAAAATDEPTRTPTEDDAPTDAPTRAAVAVGDATDTPTVTDAPRTVIAPPPATATVTDAPALTPTATNTATVTDAPATSTPTRPTATTTAPAALDNAAAQVLLIYDPTSLTAYNRSEEPADLSDLRFVQTLAEGGELVFLANRWGGGTAPVSALPAGDCFQVWTFEDTDVDPPAACEARHAWRQVSSIREFWISAMPGATFSVLRDGEVLAECEIDAGDCLVDVGD